MRPMLALALALVVAGCGDKEPEPAKPPVKQSPYVSNPAAKPATIDQSSPKALVEGIFAAARSGNLALLKGIADPVDADGDSKDVANVSTAPAEQQADFKKQFANGKLDGEVEIKGDKAEVLILFGADPQSATLKLVKRDGKWYLQSF